MQIKLIFKWMVVHQASPDRNNSAIKYNVNKLKVENLKLWETRVFKLDLKSYKS